MRMESMLASAGLQSQVLNLATGRRELLKKEGFWGPRDTKEDILSNSDTIERS